MSNIIKMITGNSVSSIRNKTTKALSIFTETVEKLRKLNEEAMVEMADRDKKMAKLQQEHVELTGLVVDNNKTIAKINQIIN